MDTALQKQSLYINGEWMPSENNETILVTNPATLEVIGEIPRGGGRDVEKAVSSAREAFESREWEVFSPAVRGRILYEMADFIRENSEELAMLETLDVGKPISQSKADAEAAARYFEYYAGITDKIFGETIPVEPDILNYTVREPVGVTAHIIPWNYPLQIAARSAAISIATGNSAVIKPAEDASLTTLALARLLSETDLPKGIVNVVTGYGVEAGQALANHPGIDHVTFTGSVKTGTTVMTAAARNVVPVTLELGGKSPNIVFGDCDQEEAVKNVTKAIIQNAGQTCSAGSRLLVQASIYDEFVEKTAEILKNVTIGPGIDDKDMGPIISKKQYDRIISFLDIAEREGARIVTGGISEYGGYAGHFMHPVIVEGLSWNSKLIQEEIFGPVLVVSKFENEEEAIELANCTEFGLVAGVWTKDIKRAHTMAKHIKAGQVFINNYGAGGGVQMPFGGYKKSGIGREKGLEALRNYTQLKNIALKL